MNTQNGYRARVTAQVYGKRIVQSLPAPEVRGFARRILVQAKLRHFDLIYNRTNDVFRCRPRNGRIVRHPGTIPKLGKKGVAFTVFLLRHSGRNLRPCQIGHGTGIDSFWIKDNVITFTAKLRAALRETATNPCFIQTALYPYRVGVRRDKNILLIEYEDEDEPAND